MKLLELDPKSHYLKLRIDGEDDLWDLYNVLYKGDRLIGRTTREIKEGSSSKRRSMFLEVKIEWAELQPMANRLRVHGIVTAGPEEFDVLGKNHTISISSGDEIAIYKDESWIDMDIRRLKDAERRVTTSIMICAVDSEDFAAAKLMNYGLDILEKISIDYHIKGTPELEGKYKSSKLQMLAKEIIQKSGSIKARKVIIAGPAFLKEQVRRAVLDINPAINIDLMDTSYGGVKGIYEVVKKGALQELLREFDIVEEDRLMEEFNRRISKDGAVLYGIKDIEEASKIGAIETLMVSNDVLHSSDLEIRRRTISLMEDVERKKGKVKIFMAEHNTKIWLKSLGGIAALLRFKV